MLLHIVLLVQYQISSVVTPSEDRVADLDTEHVEKDGSDAVGGTKGNPRR